MKKGFTLIEVLGVIVVLAIILAITSPLIMGVIASSKESAYDTQVEVLLDSAYHYSVANDLGTENNVLKKLEISEIVNAEILDKIPENPLTNNEFEGCIIYNWSDEAKKYGFEYSETCEIPVNLMQSGFDFQRQIGNLRETITKIEFNSIKSKDYDTAEIKFDFSDEQNELVIGYIEEIGEEQILHVQANGIITGHPQSNSNCSNNYYASLFCDFESLEELEFNNVFDTSKFNSLAYMFSNAKSLKNLDLSGFNTENVTNMAYAFTYTTSLIKLDLGDEFDTSNVTNMDGMFFFSTQLEELILGDKFDTSNVVNMNMMFYYLSELEELNLGDKFDTSNVTTMWNMFSGLMKISELNLGEKFDTSNVTNMGRMFNALSSVKELNLGDKFDTSNVTNMEVMFGTLTSLENLNLGDKFDTSNVTSMYWMFAYMDTLEILDLSMFNIGSVTSSNGMFDRSYSITTVYAKDQATADFFNATTNKPSNVVAIPKP